MFIKPNNMKILFILSFLMLSFESYCQYYKKTPISHEEIEMSLVDIDYFRAVMVENSFKFNRKNDLSEEWVFSSDVNEPGYHNPRILISVKLKKEDSFIQDVNFNAFGKITSVSSIYITVDRLLPKYIEQILKGIKSEFKLRKVVPTYWKRGDDEEIVEYYVFYYNEGSKFKAIYTETEDDWYCTYIFVKEIDLMN